jgi:hypothetical protein
MRSDVLVEEDAAAPPDTLIVTQHFRDLWSLLAVLEPLDHELRGYEDFGTP